MSIPYQFLIMDFGDGSLGSNRVALMQTYRTFENWQAWLVDRFLQRLWNWRIAKAIKSGELPPAPVDKRGFSEWYRVTWVPPEYSWIDPQKEAAANLAEFKLGISSISSFARKRGKDGEDVMREKLEDMASAARLAREINQRDGTNFTWRDVIDIAQPGQTAPSNEPQQQGDDNG
jgi:capsid protein